MRIPEQLQGWRFIKLKSRDKIPIEPKWTTTATYGYSDSGLLEHIKAGGNYGVLGSEDHVIVDGDTPEIQQAVEGHLPLTFTVRTPGHQGRHYYFLCKLERPIRLRDKNKVNVGDIQGIGKQVVGPNCIHPNGKTYEIVNDRPPNWIAPDDLKRALKEFIIKEPPVEEFAVGERTALKNEGLGSDIAITNVHSAQGMIRRGDEYEGTHPVHGSDGGHNFSINPVKNVWVCRRHDTGGGPLSLLAVKEGIVKCEDATRGALRGETFKKVLELARSKGLLEQAGDPIKYFTLKENGKIDKFVAKRLSDELIENGHFKTHMKSGVIFNYDSGYYADNGIPVIKVKTETLLGQLCCLHYVNEVIGHIERSTFTSPDTFNSPIDLVCLENGIYNLSTGELQDHTPDLIFLGKIPVEYDPDAKCPKFSKFLNEILPADYRPLIQELFGYCLTRDYPLARAFMLLGEGNNGKSTLIGVLTAFVGRDNVATPSLQDIVKNRFAQASLYGKLVNAHADIPSSKIGHSGRFKMLTGQDEVFAELKHKDAFKFRNYAKLIYSANELPQTDDMSEAFWRRWILIKFSNVFPEGDPKTDPNILTKLTTPEELSGILNWALEGLKRLLENKKFSTTQSSDSIKREWITRTDSLRAFVFDSIGQDARFCITKDDFYNALTKFCDEMETTPIEKQMVGRQLPVLLPKVIGIPRVTIGGKQTRVWKGIRFKTTIHDVISYFWCVGGKYIIYRGEDSGDCMDSCLFADKCKFRKTIDKSAPPKLRVEPTAQAERISRVCKIIDNLDKEYENGAPIEEVKRIAESEGITPSFVDELIDQEKQRGRMYEPKPSFVARIEVVK